MKRLTALAVALAAGMTTLAANAEVPMPDIAALEKAFAEAEKANQARAEEMGQVDPINTASVKRHAPELVATARKAAVLTGNGKDGDAESDRALIQGAKETAKGKAAALGTGAKYHEIVSRYASAYGVPVSLAHAVIAIESNYRPDARGSAGEVGLMQIKPDTARMMGFSGSTKELFNPETNIKYGMKYLGKAHELGGGTTCGTILRYNAGHGAKRMNPVSAAYCSEVKRHLGSA
jgi:soluble lytic murein transglycosylase-like protein